MLAQSQSTNFASSPSVRSAAFGRVVHSALLLGYGLVLSLLTLLFLVWFNTLEWIQWEDNGIPRLNNRAVLHGILIPMLFFHVMATVCNVYQSVSFPDAGPREVKIPLLIGAIMVPVVYAIQHGILEAGVDSTYWGLDLVLQFVASLVFIVCDAGTRHKRASARGVGSGWLPPEVGDESNVQEDQPSNKSSMEVFFGLLPFLATVCFFFIYPFAVIPMFFSGGTTTRLLICLALHPVLLEAAEAFGRGSFADEISNDLRKGKISFATAEGRIIQSSAQTYVLKQLMAYYRRMMLLNMGSPTASLTAVVAAAVEEAVSRGFLVQLDTYLRRIRGRAELEGDDLHLQRLVWMCDANQSCFAEYTAIFTSTFSYILLQSHSFVIALGYEPDVSIDAASVFVQLLVEVFLELLVDYTTMWAEAEHGIPITTYFSFHVNGMGVIGVQTTASLISVVFVIYAFLRHPHFGSCDSNVVCDCVSQRMFEPWYLDACSSLRNETSISGLNHSIEVVSAHADLFGSIDFVAVLVALLTGLATLVLVMLAVLFARYRKRKLTVVALMNGIEAAQRAKKEAEAFNEKLKRSLERAKREVDAALGESEALLRPYRIKYQDLTLIEEIGHGSFGVVWRGTFRGELVAIKTVRLARVSRAAVKDFLHEILIMAPLSHPNLVKLIGGCWSDGPDKLCIVLEFCEGGSLKHLLSDANNDWKTPYFAITRGIVMCLRYLHHEQPSGESLIHRDLKPDNIMISDNIDARVGDFGTARRQTHGANEDALEEDRESALALTIVDDCSVDVYSFSITLLEIGCCSHSFVVQQFVGMPPLATAKGWRPSPRNGLLKSPPGLWSLIKQCWNSDPHKRPSFARISTILDGIKLHASPVQQIRADLCFDDSELEQETEIRSMADVVHELRLTNAKLRDEIGKLKQANARENDNVAVSLRGLDEGILGGMFVYDPDRVGSILGEGAFGTVHCMKNPYDGQRYAVKDLAIIENEDGSPDHEAMFALLEEVRKLGIVSSEYIVGYVTACAYQERFYVVMELVEGSELRDVIIRRRDSLAGDFCVDLIKHWITQLAQGLRHLHEECHLVHQDLHNGNIMIAGLGTMCTSDLSDDAACMKQTTIKILDLGLSSFKTAHALSTMRTASENPRGRRKSVVEIRAQDLRGFKAIRAPELHTDTMSLKFDSKVDMWAMGLLLSELTLLTPIEEWYEERAIMQTFGRSRALQLQKVSEVRLRSSVIGYFVARLLEENPRQRVSASDILREIRLTDGEIFASKAERELKPLSGLGPDELLAVKRMAQSALCARLVKEPPHIGGGIALLRSIKHHEPIKHVTKMLDARLFVGSAAIHADILERGYSMATMPETENIRAATLFTNEMIGVDAGGDLVSFERWGAIVPAKFLQLVTVEQFAQWNAYRCEGRAIILNILSRRARRLVGYAIIGDFLGGGFSHRKLWKYFKEYISGSSARSIPDLRSATYFVRGGSVVTPFIAFLKNGFMTDRLKRTTVTISGSDPYQSSSEFSERFGRNVLPVSLSGTLQDEFCCRGIVLPAIRDDEGLWQKYTAFMHNGVWPDDSVHRS